MGMDPVQQNEVYEVVVQIDGPVTEAALDESEDELRKFVKKLKTIANGTGKVKARKAKAGIRPKAD